MDRGLDWYEGSKKRIFKAFYQIKETKESKVGYIFIILMIIEYQQLQYFFFNEHVQLFGIYKYYVEKTRMAIL